MKTKLLLLFSISVIFLSAQDYTRAPNSYIYDVDYAELNNYGGLEIPVIKAYRAWADDNGFIDENIPGGTQSAAIYWEDVPGLIRSVSISGSGENAIIRVAIDKAKGKGNASISLHVGAAGDATDPIYWTWHVWVTDDPTDGKTYAKGFETDVLNQPFDPTYMDRNLGATNSHFLGDDWAKSGGLLYQWGRKDPFPPLLHKDRYYYELTGSVGSIVNGDVLFGPGAAYNNVERPFNDIKNNIKYSINHPTDLIANSTGPNWFSNQTYDTDTPEKAWDLWADQYEGAPTNAFSSNPTSAQESKSYEVKSPYDPCPGGYRVPSHYGRKLVNNGLAPHGRGGGGNDDVYNSWSTSLSFHLSPTVNGGEPLSTFLHTVENPSLTNLKVYPKLGFEFKDVSARDLGRIPMNGNFEIYNSGGSKYTIYQDELADGGLWLATYGASEARFLHYIDDADQPDNGVGRYMLRINDISNTMAGFGVRCIEDPNENQIGVFTTAYIQTPEFDNYNEGVDNPNSYLVEDISSPLHIKVNKAFAMYNQFLEPGQMLPENDLKTNVLWTTNPSLINTVILVPNGSDPKDSDIVVSFNAGETGNAVVSLHNGSISNPAYWSWHVWVPETAVGTITYTTEDIINTPHHLINLTKSKYPPLTTHFMDRNLGALEKFPTVTSSPVTDPVLIAQIKESGGFHYQWGRKDPIPTFKKVGSSETYDIYRGTAVSGSGTVSYQPTTGTDYLSFYTEDYPTYSVAAGVSGTADKFTNATKVMKYGAENPLTFLYHSGTGSQYINPASIDYDEIRDWISNSVAPGNERSLKPDRWGHGTSKSPFDPCPEGWRVPDVSVVLLRTSQKGTSPWYFGNTNGGNGLNQQDPYSVSTTFGGLNVSTTEQAGWLLNDTDYAIGNFPKTGIRGELGGDTISSNTGLWTSALSDYLIGYGLAMEIGSDNKIRTGTGIYPQAGMNVRCSKDEPRYVADETLDNDEIYISENEQLLIYPNPVHDILHFDSDKKFEFAIFDLNGRMMDSGVIKDRRIDFTYFPKGIYILILDKSIVKKVIKK